jgi:hypothetical protein
LSTIITSPGRDPPWLLHPVASGRAAPARAGSGRCCVASGLPEDDFVHHFAGDIDPLAARVLYAVQQPLAASALQDVMGVPAWKSLPSWYLVAANDQAIPPDAERRFAQRMRATTVEGQTNHLAMLSHPDGVVTLIKMAAEAVPAGN